MLDNDGIKSEHLTMDLAQKLTGGMSGGTDNVPAMLTEGEYVVPRHVVARLGGGDVVVGAQRLDEMLGIKRGGEQLMGALMGGQK